MSSSRAHPKASGVNGSKHLAGVSKNPSATARSKPLVIDEHGAIIVSDSDDDPQHDALQDDEPRHEPLPRRFIPPKLKALPSRKNPRPLASERMKKRVERPQDKNKKRMRDTDEEEERNQGDDRRRDKTHERQAANKLIIRELEAAKKEADDLKVELEEKMADLRKQVECEICLETLWKPWALSDCGHTFCQTCLVSLFDRQKFECPTCRARVTHRPVEIFAFKSVIHTISGVASVEVDILDDAGRVWDPFWPAAGGGN
ncbi:hypothetical protein AURDEDRAFT_176736 [Auricularia subglabra TFB-10046 SS5]|nr:hypothetical protein AURDEDRAFT_176736 [Auricularia subglabra TFB-10046 SS5]